MTIDSEQGRSGQRAVPDAHGAEQGTAGVASRADATAIPEEDESAR